jgi:polysaccharide export outer membrane protein
LTAIELEALVATKLKEAHLLQSPEVLVHVLEYMGKPFYMVGQIDRPGEYSMSQDLTLMDAILLAGGLDYTAAEYGYLHRRLPGSTTEMASASVFLNRPAIALPGTEVLKFDLAPLKRGGILHENPVLKKGDVFVVPARPLSEFYVIGDVQAPGRYELPPENPLYASQAIAQAGGPMKTAKTKHGVMIRILPDGSRVERKIDFRQVLKAKDDDFTIQRNDVLFIPGSRTKNIGYGLLGAIPNAVQRSVTQEVRTVGGPR